MIATKIQVMPGTILTALLALTLNAPSQAFEIIAHRGVYQSYGRENLTNETCTADRIVNSGHAFLENTIASMREAFRLGATTVELDVHPTTEGEGKHDGMVVFHDWTLDCRTNARCNEGCRCNVRGECLTHDQNLAYLKSLDIGYGYTSDHGKTFPFRGKYVGQMPTLEEALDLIQELPTKQLTINLKDHFQRTADILYRILSQYPLEVRKRVHLEYYGQDSERFRRLGVQEAVYQGGGPGKACFLRQLLLGWSGYFPEVCRNTQLFVPLHERLGRFNRALNSVRATDLLWGWPAHFIERAHAHGTRIYVSQVNSLEDLEQVSQLPIDGIMTDRIEVIGPAASLLVR